MRAEVLMLRTSGLRVPRSLYTYLVPDRLASEVAPGQLVAVPFGPRSAAGIIWALDAGEDAQEVEDAGAPAGADDGSQVHLIRDILLPLPLLPPAQRALAEWLADHYASPLSAVARLFLPPGLARGIRSVLRPRLTPPQGEPLLSAGEPPSLAPGDVAYVLGMLQERGQLERGQLDATLGRRRAGTAIQQLIAGERATLSAELASGLVQPRRQRSVRLIGLPATLDAWRLEARARLDGLPPVPKSHPRWQTVSPEERQAERILRQLAVLDVLSCRPVDSDTPAKTADWRIEELRRFTRATQSALDELVAAGLISIEDAELRRDPLAGRDIAPSAPLPLTSAQVAALNAIVDAGSQSQDLTEDLAGHGRNDERDRVILLHGITGSGKTEVYLQALAAVIAQGKRCMVLVPEIALTPQAMARFAGRFPGRVALLHSGLTDGERLDEWRRIQSGAVDVVLGSRSALFAPIDELGLIVVDEEHEVAYKQERSPSYSAREAAVRLGVLTGATVVLGSATPSVESYWLATTGVYQLVELRQRAPTVAGSAVPPDLPPVTLVDLRAELRAGNTSILSEALCAALRHTLERGEQAILFLNRRGTASAVICRECGYVVQCSDCDISMTYHATERAVICHYCGRRQPAPETCPVCWSASVRYFGLGTERVESAVKRQFPGARVLRWDRDIARTRHVHEDLLHAFSQRRADVLVGTQMIAKGLDLPAVTLVGVISADIALFLPDLRAGERPFQLLTQVAGRAGRGAAPGRVLVQTFNPEHFCIQAAARHDYAAFFDAEVLARQRYGYPPFRRFVKYTYEHADRYTAQVEATVLADRLETLIHDHAPSGTDLVGPAPAFLERLRGRYRWQLILRSPDPRPVLRVLAAEGGVPLGWSIDVDPASTL